MINTTPFCIHFLRPFSRGLALVSCLLFAACDSIDSDEKALINILLIDAPGDFDEVWLEVLGAEILPSGGRGSDKAEWLTIDYIPANKMVKVSDLVGTQRLLVGRREIRAAEILGARLLLGGNNYVVRNGQRIDLTMPPNFSTQLTADVSLQASPGFAWDLYIDINLAQSIRTGPTGTVEFHPVLRAFSLQNRGEIRGTVQPAPARPHIFAIKDADTVSTLTAVNGEFRLRGLTAGNYRIHIRPLRTHFDSTFPITVVPDSIYILGNLPLGVRPPTNPTP